MRRARSQVLTIGRGEHRSELVAEDHRAIPPELLRRIQGAVRGRQKLLCRQRVIGEARDAERDRELRLAGELHTDLHPEALGEHVGAPLLGLGQQQRELLPARAGDRVDLALAGSKHLPDSLERGVASAMAIAVIQALEVVEIAHDHSHVTVGPAGAKYLLLDFLFEPAAVLKPGQGVRAGSFRQSLDKVGQPSAK